MNYTAMALLLSTLVLASVASFIYPPYFELSYTPLEKIKALDYLVALNALVREQKGGHAKAYIDSVKVLYGYESYQIVELKNESDWKKITVTFNHGYANITVTVELRLETLRILKVLTPDGNLTVYLARVFSDRFVSLEGCQVLRRSLGEAVVETLGEFCDSRGLCVSP